MIFSVFNPKKVQKGAISGKKGVFAIKNRFFLQKSLEI